MKILCFVLFSTSLAALGADRSELARLPWPLTTVAEDSDLEAHAGELDPAIARAWAADRLLPAMAGLVPIDPTALAPLLATTPSAAMRLLDDARDAYGKGELARAAALYGEVSQQSALWPEALGERAWALHVLGRADEALGAAVSLQAPYFAVREHAEAELLRAGTLVTRCRFEEARHVVESLGALPDEAPIDPEGWKREEKPADASAGAWSAPLVARVRAGWRLAKTIRPERVEAIENLGDKLYDDALRGERDRARALRARAIAIRYEALRGERKLLERGLALAKPVIPDGRLLEDDEVAWTFDGTFWRDELGTYRVVAGDACPREQRP